MIPIGRYSFRLWVKGLATAPESPACVVVVKTYHTNAPAEVLSVQPTKDLRATLLDFAASGRLSRAITENRSPGCAITLAAVETTTLQEANAVARDLLSPKKAIRQPTVRDLLTAVKDLRARQIEQEARTTLTEVARLLKRHLR